MLRPTACVFLFAGVLACGGGGTRVPGGPGGAAGEALGGHAGIGGAAGEAPGGHAGIGGAAGAAPGGSGMGGAVAATVGDLIPSDADIYCLYVVAPDQALSLGFERACTSAKRVSGPAVTAEDRNTFCSVWGGTPVAACPATDPAVAYCSWTTGDPSSLNLEVVRVIEPGTVTPDAAAVVRDPDSSCGTAPVYDTSHHRLTPTCTGTFSASVDGVRADFLGDHTCRFVTDGKRAVWGFNTSLIVTPPSPSLQMELHKEDTGLSFGILTFGSAGIIYQEGSARFITQPNSSTTYQSEVFDAAGMAIKGTFNIGPATAGAGTRTITDGVVDLRFEVK